jgi:hypothetical protein
MFQEILDSEYGSNVILVQAGHHLTVFQKQFFKIDILLP